MTSVIINDILPLTQSIATSGQTVYSTNWTANAASDVVVYSRADATPADDETQILSYPSQYSVAFIGDQQTVQVTLVTPSTLGDVVTITRQTPADRENLYSNTNFVPSMLNNDFGILTLVDQQAQLVNQQVGPRYNYSAFIDPIVDTILPILGASQIWYKNSDNDAIEALTIPTGSLAPGDADYLIALPNSDLPNAIVLSTFADGLMINSSGTQSIKTVVLTGSSNQITVMNGSGVTGNPTVLIANNPVIPGTAGMGIPQGTTGQRVVPVQGISLRFNTTFDLLEYWDGNSWAQIDNSSFEPGDGINFTDGIISLGSPTGSALSLVQGDMLYCDVAHAIQRLPKSAVANQYISNSGSSNNPVWASIAASNLTNGTTGTGAIVLQTSPTINTPSINNFNVGVTTNVATGTITLTVASNQLQNFSGIGSATVVLPDATTLLNGWSFQITNNASGNISVKDATNTLNLCVIPPGGKFILYLLSNSILAGSWDARGELPFNALFGNSGLTITGLISAGQFNLTGSSSGTISIIPQAAAGTYNFNLPTTAGTSGYLLTSAGGGSSPMTWTPITSTGAITQINADSGSATPTSGVLTINGGSTGLTTSASSSTVSLTGTLASNHGGTGVANSALNTITLGGTIVTVGNFSAGGAFSTSSTVSITGAFSTAGAFSTVGAFPVAFTFSGSTALTFPTSGTVATTANTVTSVQGTANQILVNGTSGSPVNGVIALTIPTQFNITSESLSGILTIAATSSSSVGAIYQGASSLLHTYGTRNTFCGVGAGNFTLSGTDNVGFGSGVMPSITTGENNVGVGPGALFSIIQGARNTALGSRALNIVTSGSDNVIIGNGAGIGIVVNNANVIIGSEAGQAANADSNVFIGYTCAQVCQGSGNVAIGINALINNAAGNQNVIIGSAAGQAYTNLENFNICIRNDGVVGETGAIRIGDSLSTNLTFIQGISGTTVTGTAVLCSATGQLGTVVSSRRYKENIKDMENFSSRIMNLSPKTFNYKKIPDQIKPGLIAEEVEEIIPELVFYKNGEPESVHYEELPVLLLNELQKLSRRVFILESQMVH